MECLVQIAATRKALFSGEDQRSKFISSMMSNSSEIILSSKDMNDPECYNHFCRLLQRFRTTAQLNEMAEKPGYLPWIELVADFTQKAFQQQTYAPTTTCFYLLGFWSKVVQNMAYFQQLGEETVLKLEEITVALTSTFMSTYIESVPTRIEEMLDGKLKMYCIKPTF